MNYIPILLLTYVVGMFLIYWLGKDLRHSFFTTIIVLTAVGMFVFFKTYQLVLIDTPFWIYFILGTLNYAITFFAAEVMYADPVKKFLGDASHFPKKKKVRFCVSVFKEEGFIGRCINSIIESVKFASDIAEVEIFIVNDASPDNTWEKLQQFKDLPGVYLINLQKNVGKKGGLAAAMMGGEHWAQIFELFQWAFGIQPGPTDRKFIEYHARDLGLAYTRVDYYCHTDSDSVVSKEFIRYIIFGFESSKYLGAISGHCDVWRGDNPTFVTLMQEAWYFTQFRIRKAAESVFGAVFCVSGPGAGFRSDAILHTLYSWVYDKSLSGKVYRGATDRKLTLLVLKGYVVIDGVEQNTRWRIEYSELARVWTVVPDTWGALRSQWTRWKQNFWHVFPEVFWFAWKVHPVAAFLVYSHLIITVSGPFLLSYHLIAAFFGGIWLSLLYILGILMVGSLMAMGYLVRNPSSGKSAFLRPLISIVSAVWGSPLTMLAFNKTFIQRTFAWRSEGKKVEYKRYLYYKWFGIDPIFETRFVEIIMIIVIIIYIIRYFTGW